MLDDLASAVLSGVTFGSNPQRDVTGGKTARRYNNVTAP
jgi:hypothetical protein